MCSGDAVFGGNTHPDGADRFVFCAARGAGYPCDGDGNIDAETFYGASRHTLGGFLAHRAIFTYHARRDPKQLGLNAIIIGNNAAFENGR